MFKEYDLDALILDCSLDDHFITFLEMHENGVKFKRIDSDISDTLGTKDDENNEEVKNLNKEIEDMFKGALGEKVSKISVEGLKNEDTSAMILISEESRRMAEMSKMYARSGMGAMGMFKEEETLVVNNTNPLVKKLVGISKDESKKDEVKDESKKDEVNLVCEHIFDLAKIANKELDADEMDNFIKRNNKILNMITEL